MAVLLLYGDAAGKVKGRTPSPRHKRSKRPKGLGPVSSAAPGTHFSSPAGPLRQCVASGRSKVPALEVVVVDDAHGWATMLRDADVPAQREVLAALMDQVVPGRVRRGQDEARITWTPLGQAFQESVELLSHDPAA